MSLLAETIVKLKSAPSRYRYLLLFAAVFGGSILVHSINYYTEDLLLDSVVSTVWDSHRHQKLNSDKSFTIKTEGCTIPNLMPYDASIRKYIVEPKGYVPCNKLNGSLLSNNDSHIWLETNMLPYYNLSEDANVTCCYKAFYRPPPSDTSYTIETDDRVEYFPCIEFSSYIAVQDEFVRVKCIHASRVIYEQFFLFARRKSKNYTKYPEKKPAYNVLVMGIDSISRLNFYRTMPKSLAYLRKKGAVELLGYNKVGDNTFPNIIPMLLGIKDTDLKQTCWPNSKTFFDKCPFIWNWYRNAGYYTALGEDSAFLGTFNYEKFGFRDTPTDYYIHTFMHEAENYVGNNKDYNAYVCMGDKYFYKVLLDYVLSLFSVLKSSKLFGFIWETTMSHDYLNYPMLMDSSYEEFLRKLDHTKYLEDTILILLSDHGMRWGSIRFTKQGRLEERLPFVYLLLPPSFRENFSLAYDNVKLNSKRLTTPFDIYATLTDLIDLDSLKNDEIRRRTRTNYSKSRGISLFLPIPGNRTCQAAAVEDHWCTCHRNTKLPTNSREAADAAFYLIRHLNSLLREHYQCAKLSLKEILDATEMVAGAPRKNEVGWREFTVVVRTKPGGGVFEATLRRDDARRWALAGSPSRLNLYGEQSRCVHHYQLKLYCYCR